MTIEQVKEEAKKRFDKDLTDEQAQAWLDAHPAGELQDEELADVAGGGCGGGDSDPPRGRKNLPQMGPCPRCGCNEFSIAPPVADGTPLYLCTGCGMYFFPLTGKWVE